jgi:cytochrome P450
MREIADHLRERLTERIAEAGEPKPTIVAMEILRLTVPLPILRRANSYSAVLNGETRPISARRSTKVIEDTDSARLC